MSDKKKIPNGIARTLAESLRVHFLHVCEPGFLEVVGSLRRCKPMVGDIELLFVPKVEPVKTGLFAEDVVTRNLAEQLIEDMLQRNALTKRLNVSGGISSWGPLNKHSVHVETGIPVDLFATTKENWWVSLVIRTGSKETNLKLTTGAQKLGRTLNAYGRGITDEYGNVIAATSEQHVFELCNVPYLEPHQR